MPQHIPFPSIEQFRSVIKRVKDNYAYHGKLNLPTLKYVGTVKLHGTNAAIVTTMDIDGAIWAQSRSNIISVGNDNAGFASWVDLNQHALRLYLNSLKATYVSRKVDSGDYIVVFGEWCGQGIQKGAAICQVPSKQFVLFDACVVNKHESSQRDWLTPLAITLGHARFEEEAGPAPVKLIYDYPTYDIEIDFNHPEDVQNKLIELTNAVEAECPVAKAFGVSGVGEGIVWRPDMTDLALKARTLQVPDLIFKVKGEKHSVTKVKTLAAVDVEKIESIKALVASVLTEARLEQGFDHLREIGLKRTRENTGVFIKWVCGDVIKEERDTIEANGFDVKEVMKYVSKEAGIWYGIKTS